MRAESRRYCLMSDLRTVRISDAHTDGRSALECTLASSGRAVVNSYCLVERALRRSCFGRMRFVRGFALAFLMSISPSTMLA